MHNPEPVLKNDTRNLLWDFEIEMDHLISARRPDLVIANNNNNNNNNKKENLWSCGLYCPGRPQSIIERKRKEGYVPGACQGTGKTVKH